MAPLPNHDDFEAQHRAEHTVPVEGCYACKLDRVNLQFTYGKDDFHGPTVRERREEHIKDSLEHGRVLGRDYEAVGSRWV